MRVKVGDCKVSPEEKAAVLKVLESDQLSPGPVVKAFEEEFAYWHKAKYGVMVNSGTDALRIGLLAMKEYFGWPDGSYVIVPAITFVATVNVILQAGLKPYFVDVSMYDATINPYNLDRRLTCQPDNSNVKAIIPVHLFGKKCQMKPLLEFAKKWKLKVLEDSCECMGVGNVEGDVAAYSSYVCHMISTGVGGIALTNNEKLEKLMRSYANHGRSYEHIPGNTLSKDITKRFVFDRIGYSARATEMEAAIGLEQLKKLPEYIETRRKIAQALIKGLDGLDAEIRVPFDDLWQKSGWMMFPLVMQKWSKYSKWDLCQYLENHGIETRELLPLINQPCYKQLKIDLSQFPVADDFNKNGFYIGCHPGMTSQDVKFVVRTFKQFFDKHTKS